MRLPELRVFILLTTGLLTGACGNESGPTPTDSQALLLSKKVTAFYNSSAATIVRYDTATAQPTVYQKVAFYPAEPKSGCISI